MSKLLRTVTAAILLAAAAPAPLALEGTPEQGALLRGRAPAGTVALTAGGAPVPLAPDGSFLVGIDRDHDGALSLEARLAGGERVTERIAVRPRAWRLERVDVALRPGGPSAEYLRRRAVELERIAAARARRSDAQGWRQQFVRPAGGRVSGVFGSQRIYRGEPGSFHTGVDYAAGAGAAVVAPADGVVVLAGPPDFSLEGQLVIVDHGMGLNSAFLHLSRTDVREGQQVRRGEPIGRVGASGRATGPHLHWSVKWMDARIDPERLVAGGG